MDIGWYGAVYHRRRGLGCKLGRRSSRQGRLGSDAAGLEINARNQALIDELSNFAAVQAAPKTIVPISGRLGTVRFSWNCSAKWLTFRTDQLNGTCLIQITMATGHLWT